MMQAEVVFMSDNAHRTLPHVLRLKRLGIDTYQEPVTCRCRRQPALPISTAWAPEEKSRDARCCWVIAN